jgi:MFS family permease
MEEAAAGAILFLTSLGMGIAAQSSGRLSDRFGPRPFAIFGFSVLVVTSLPMAFLTEETSLWVISALLFVNGLGMGLWNVPNTTMIMGSVPQSSFGVVGAFTNLTRNVGNVTGQAVASGVVVAVMVANGFDIPLSQIAGNPGAGAAFVDGWRLAYVLVTLYSIVGLALAIRTKPPRELRAAATSPAATADRSSPNESVAGGS